eukprot:1142409-Pelagomonas_calceolata.AAC.10
MSDSKKSTMVTMVTMGGDLQPGRLADRQKEYTSVFSHDVQRSGKEHYSRGASSGGMPDIRRAEGGACGLGAGQGVHFMCWHQCSEGCSTGFCLWSAAASS